MTNILVQSLVCFLAIYGMIQLGINIYSALHNISIRCCDELYIIITVKNQQDTIEGIVRSVVWKSLNNKQGGMVPNILVVDMGSSDDTLIILRRLRAEYDFIQITDSEGYMKLMEKWIR